MNGHRTYTNDSNISTWPRRVQFYSAPHIIWSLGILYSLCKVRKGKINVSIMCNFTSKFLLRIIFIYFSHTWNYLLFFSSYLHNTFLLAIKDNKKSYICCCKIQVIIFIYSIYTYCLIPESGGGFFFCIKHIISCYDKEINWLSNSSFHSVWK